MVHPIASMSWRTEHHAILAICVAWVLILALSTPALVVHGEVSTSANNTPMYRFPSGSQAVMYRVYVDPLLVPGNRGCLTAEKSDGLSDHSAVRLAHLPGVLFSDELCLAPGADMYFLHVHAGQAMARHARQRREPTRKETSHETRLHHCRCVRCLLVSLAGKGLSEGTNEFSALRHPISSATFTLQVILVIKSLDIYQYTTATIMVQIASHILAYMNSCVNPFLYAFLSDKFRKAFWKLIHCRPRAEPNNRLEPATRTTRAASSGDIL